MSILFSPYHLGYLDLKNRFVHSATYEGVAQENGEVTGRTIKRYRTLAKGEVGLIITGHMYVHPWGKAQKYQTGISDDHHVAGLGRLVDAVHQQEGKIIFQLSHCGAQTTKALIGRLPLAPSDRRRDPTTFLRPARLREEEIKDIIQAFGQATQRAVTAGADGIQIHGAHGYLTNQFLSPFLNDRTDAWGGTIEKRFRFLKEIVLRIKENMPEGMPLLIKLNSNDFTPQEGITPDLAAEYAVLLSQLGISGIEVSGGTGAYSFMNICRGEVPIKEMLNALPWWKKPIGKIILSALIGKYDLEEGYNLNAAKIIRSRLNDLPLLAVGGFRDINHMEETITNGDADFISMCRPFIKEPFIVKKFREGRVHRVKCTSCNKCFAAVINDIPIRCYATGYP